VNDTALINKTLALMITAEFADGSINKNAVVIIKFAGSNERN
jgi:hypothetical protein